MVGKSESVRYKLYKCSYIFTIIELILYSLCVITFFIEAAACRNNYNLYLDDSYKIIATAYTWIGVILCISYAWTIPMLIFVRRAMNDVGEQNEVDHIILGICQILFFSFLPGMFTLIAAASVCDYQEHENNEYKTNNKIPNSTNPINTITSNDINLNTENKDIVNNNKEESKNENNNEQKTIFYDKNEQKTINFNEARNNSFVPNNHQQPTNVSLNNNQEKIYDPYKINNQNLYNPKNENNNQYTNKTIYNDQQQMRNINNNQYPHNVQNQPNQPNQPYRNINNQYPNNSQNPVNSPYINNNQYPPINKNTNNIRNENNFNKKDE